MAARIMRSHTLCNFKVADNEQGRHPLHISVEDDPFHVLFGKTEETVIIVALERCSIGKTTTGSARLFAVVEKTHSVQGSHQLSNKSQSGKSSLNSPEIEQIKQPATILYCTSRFIGHYGFNADEMVRVRPVQMFPLDRVVVAVTSDRALAWAQNKFFSTGLLLSVCQQTVLVRQNDVFLAPHNVLFSHENVFDMDIFFDMEILTCEPVQQGRLTVNTEIVIIRQTTSEKIVLPPDVDSRSQTKIQEPTSVCEDDGYKPLILSDFAVGSPEDEISLTTIPRRDDVLLSNDHTKQEIQTNQFNKCGLKPIIVSSITDMRSILDPKHKGCIEDVDSTVGLSRNTLCNLGLFDGSLVDIEIMADTTARLQTQEEGQNKESSEGSKTPRSKTKRTIKVLVAEGEDIRDMSVYMSPGLSFNICRKTLKHTSSCSTKLNIQKSPQTDEELSLEAGDGLSSSWSWRGSIPYAGEVHLSIVNSPHYAVSTNTTEVLKQYFSTPRLVKKGDVLSIPSTLDVDYCGMELSDGSGCRHPIIYFRAVRIHPALPSVHTYWIDTKHSVLFQDGAVNSYIPAAMPMVLHDDRGVLPPPGMSRLLPGLIEIVRPHLHHRRRADDPVPSVLLVGQAGSGKRLLSSALAASLNLHLFQVNAHELCGDTSASTEARVKAMMTRATTYAPCILHLRNIHVFGKAADGNTEEPRTAGAFHDIIRQQLTEHNKWPVVVVASTAQPKHVNLDLYEGFLHQQTIEVPNESERQEMLTEILRSLPTMGEINIPHVAQRTAGFVLGDLFALIGQAHRQAQSRLFKYCSAGRQTGMSLGEEEDLVLAGVTVTQVDFEAALDSLQSAHSDSIGAPKIPQVSWEDVGGLVSVKAEILDTIQLPLQHPELLAAGLRRSGVLLYGPPGTGKTLLAKAVATECSLNFLSVKGPELINMYVGQSEENVREVFQRARSAAPCVIFFDELDSLAPNRGRSGDSGGVMDRVVSQLLAELDGMNKSADVFVIGATNRPDLLDPALLRPGRFDKLLYLGVSEDRSSQLNILTALTRKFILTPGCSLENVVEQCPLNMTGADFYALCSDAMLNALKRKIALLNQGVAVDQSRVEVEEDDFRDALATLVPSVSIAELARYQSLQHVFSDKKPKPIAQ